MRFCRLGGKESDGRAVNLPDEKGLAFALLLTFV